MKLKNNEIEFLKNLKDNYYHDKEERELDERTLYNKVKEWAKTKDYIAIPLIQREWSVDFDRAWGYFLGLQQIADSTI